GIAFTATLLASLVATVAAPLALASVTVTSAGSVPRGGTSTGTATFAFQENFAACFDAIGSPDLSVVITDSAGNPTVHFVGTPTGVLANSQAIGDTAGLINVNAGSCPFEITAGTPGSADYGGSLTFATAAETRTVTADNGDVIVAGQQPITTDALTKAHAAGE